MVKSMVRVLVMSGVIGVFTTATYAAQAADQREVGQDQKSIVGSWMGINETGERWLTSFTSDGIVLNSVQSEVSLTRPVGVLTPGTACGWISGTGNSRSPKWPSSTISKRASTD